MLAQMDAEARGAYLKASSPLTMSPRCLTVSCRRVKVSLPCGVSFTCSQGIEDEKLYLQSIKAQVSPQYRACAPIYPTMSDCQCQALLLSQMSDRDRAAYLVGLDPPEYRIAVVSHFVSFC